MKTRLLIIFVLYFSFQSVSAQDWQWASSAGGSSHDGPGDQLICIDNSGSSYYCGTFFSSPCYFHTDTLTPTGLNDMFIAKYDANGNEMWVKGFGGQNLTAMQQEYIFSICYNALANSILISGYFSGSVIIGNDTLYGSPSGGFKASLDTAGNFNWVKKDAALLATEGDGYFYGEVTYRTNAFIDTILVTPGVWLCKYTIQGKIVSARKLFDYNNGNFDAVLAEFKVKNGRIFGIGSSHTDTFTVDTITVHANFPSDQYVIACFDTGGSALWVKPTGGRNPHNYSDIEVDDDLNSYITGPFSGNAIFDGDTIETTPGGNFTAKYDSSGNFVWVNYHQNIGPGFDLAIDKENTIYLVTAVYDTANLCNSTLIGASNGNPLLVRYDSNGSCISFFESSIDMGISSVQCDSNNNVIITGAFFNTTTLGSTTITCLGTANSYIAKMDALTGIGEGERKTNTLLIYANPNDGKCNITIPDEFRNEKKLVLSIFDITGKLVQQGSVEMNEEKVRVNLEAEAKGIYNVTLSNGKKSYGGKIIFE